MCGLNHHHLYFNREPAPPRAEPSQLIAPGLKDQKDIEMDNKTTRVKDRSYSMPANPGALLVNGSTFNSILEDAYASFSRIVHAYRPAPQTAIALCLAMAVLAASLSSLAQASYDEVIHPGDQWRDDRGKLIQAHAGAVIKVGDAYFWFGEDRFRSNDPARRYISCYSSKDLVHWTFRNQVFIMSDPEALGPGWVLERPKIFYNRKSERFVLYAHLDNAHYTAARVAVAVSDTVDGNYKFVRSFRPLGKESRDIGQFVDDDGSAYLIFESRPSGGFYISKLSDDYMDVAKEVAFIHAPLEGGAIVRYGGLYYVIGSHLTGWNTNPNVFATAEHLAGPWTEFKDVAAPKTNTYNSQSGMLIRIVGSRATLVIYAGDRWNPASLWDSRYIWLPVQIGRGQFRLMPPCPWSIDVRAGTSSQLCTAK